ncbi:hypothetical protein RDE2_49190 [Rhodococcus sp. RDE2]|nr:hypothetical protein RDE2_49190 [Rhodococcus sp. RDE2]
MTAVPSVLFVCVHNAGRSQMAAGFLSRLAGDRITVRSAGSAPADEVNPAAVAATAEVGIDISGENPKILTADAVQTSDIVITMGCGDTLPGISRYVLPGLGARRPGRTRNRRRASDPGRDPGEGRGTDRRTDIAGMIEFGNRIHRVPTGLSRRASA